jgi:hypothetical protein
MCPKDVGHPMTVLWDARAMEELAEMQAHIRRTRRSDRIQLVKVEESCISGEFGIV